jgi:hypothetical protein
MREKVVMFWLAIGAFACGACLVLQGIAEAFK